MSILLPLFRFILARRYDITITGTEHLKQDGSKMIMPNHPGLIDPIIIFSHLSGYVRISPVVTETYYKKPILNTLFKSVQAVPMGDLQRGTGDMDQVSATFSGIVDGLEGGKNILLYPSGQIYSQNFESVIGKKSVYEVITRANPKTRFIVVQTKGIWGSTFSKAWDGTNPNFFKVFFQSVGILLINGFFFVPKRKVTIQIEDFTERLQQIVRDNMGNPELTRNALNSTLETFYNAKQEPVQAYVPHFWFYDDVKNKMVPDDIEGSLSSLRSTNTLSREHVPDNIWEVVTSEVARIKSLPKETIAIGGNFILDYYFDSLDMAELKSSIQSKCPLSSNPPMTDLKTVADVLEMAMGKPGNIEGLKQCTWIQSEASTKTIHDIIKSKNTELGDASTILSLFREAFSQNKNDSFVYDNILGLQSRKDFVIKAYLIAGYLRKIEGKYIGIMLPSVASSSLLLIATYLAGKVPVMLNWTVGETALLHCIHFAKIDHVLTSKSFYENIKNNGTEKIADRYIFLEELLKGVSIFRKIEALLGAWFFRIPNIDKRSPAVLLFTSGSESLPKAVPLTHSNIISDIIGSLSYFPLTTADILIGFLPPFHSFGFTINTIMPLLSGLRVAYTPNPSDAKAIANIIDHVGATTLTATPTFLKMVLAASSRESLQTLRYGVVGAEKCPESLFETFAKFCPEGKILEGYGITECSPVISINPTKLSKKGSVGLPIQGLEMLILSLDGKTRMGVGKEGMIYVRGPSVFSGYLDENIESPFEEIDGQKWYKTGDLGYLDADGYLYITGRLKRFVKIAGEMISLPFIEGILLARYGSETELTMAIEAREQNGEVKIVLFSIRDIVLEEAQSYLRENGASNLVKIAEVQVVEMIPVLGTGKIDYKVLKGMIEM